MFTSTMTYEEILNEARQDYYELKPHMEGAFYRFRRQYSPVPGRKYNLFGPISETKTFKTRRHNTWTLEMHVNIYYENNFNGGSVIFVGVPRGNNTTEYLFLWNHGDFIPELLSSHFVQRYKERYLEPNHVNLHGMHPALYFQRKNTDLRRTYFIPDQWTKEDMRNKLVWISNQGLFITVNHGGLRVYVTFLDQQNLNRYKALVYEEEVQRRMFENVNKRYDSNDMLHKAWYLLPMFTAPNARKIHERFVNRVCDLEGEEREEFVREAMDRWDDLDRMTRKVCDALVEYAHDKVQEELDSQSKLPDIKNYLDERFKPFIDEEHEQYEKLFDEMAAGK